MKKITEQNSKYHNLQKMNINDILISINNEDKTVAFAIEKSLLKIENFINESVKKMEKGGRLFYIGSGTSGRLGIVDASECPPTFGVEQGKVIGIIAGGDEAIRKAIEFAEDNTNAGWEDLLKHKISKKDIVLGLSASGTTPYVVGAIQQCHTHNILTGCITCNSNSPLSKESNFPIEVIVGPEFITGSSRMKAGTAQKLILNMISSCIMIKLGKIQDNKMVDMQLTNKKLIERGTKIIMNSLKIDQKNAKELLLKYGSVRKVLNLKI